ncbi:hypothetical protein CCR87_09830 [Rhodobaculum claviforme]|uniref:3-deoxy-D-manno-octulosonic acid transferase n=1 Tax=Rhodobaculum claviforme TaxID=1549854 RepID=A0A934TLB4_9RHOB|nr:hypothetical protein [Rhodobaculum claviforme]
MAPEPRRTGARVIPPNDPHATRAGTTVGTMDRALALTLYLAGAGARRPDGMGAAVPPPPPGRPLVWLHAPQPGVDDLGDLRGLGTLAARLGGARRGLGLILTHGSAAPVRTGRTPQGLAVHPARDHDLAWARAAFAAWDPGALVLGPGPLPPALIAAAREAGRPVFVVAGRMPGVATRWRSLPGLQRALLRQPERILVRDAACARAYRRAGARPERIEQIGPLALLPGPLPHTAAERTALARRFGARPLWLAACVPPDEEAAVLAAQRIAQRLAHRLLLVLVPTDPARGPALAEAAAAEGLRAVRRAAEEEPDDDTHLYIADTEGELGLWYRLAPVTFFGGTLSGTDSCDPLEAAALGSAVVHGPAPVVATSQPARPTRAVAACAGAAGRALCRGNRASAGAGARDGPSRGRAGDLRGQPGRGRRGQDPHRHRPDRGAVGARHPRPCRQPRPRRHHPRPAARGRAPPPRRGRG